MPGNAKKGKGADPIEELAALKQRLADARSRGMDPKLVDELIAAADKSVADNVIIELKTKIGKIKKSLDAFEAEQKKIRAFTVDLEDLKGKAMVLMTMNSDLQFEELQKKIEGGSQAIASKNAKTVSLALKELQKALNNEKKRVECERAIQEAHREVEESAKKGAFVSNARGQVIRAKNALAKKKFPTSLKHVKLAKKMAMAELAKLSRIKAEDDLRNVSALIERTKDYGIDLGAQEELLKQAKAMAKKKDYFGALDLSQKAEAQTKSLLTEFEKIKATPKFKELEKALLVLEDRIAYLESRGMKTEEFKARYASCAQSLSRNRVEEAERSIAALEADIRQQMDKMKAEDQSKEALDAISYSAAYLAETREFGIEVAEAEKIMEKAEAAFESNRFLEAKELAKEAKKTADVLKHNHFDKFPKKILEDAQKLIASLKQQNIDIRDADSLIASAKEMFDQKKFESGKSQAQQAIDTAKEAHHAYINEVTTQQILETKSSLEDIRVLGIDVSEAEGLLNKAQEVLFDPEEFVHAQDYAQQAKAIAENKLRSGYVRTNVIKSMEMTKGQLTELRSEGLDVSDLEKQIAQAEAMLEKENYIVAMDYITQAKDRTMDMQKRYIIDSVHTSMTNTQSLLSNSKEAGIDLGEAEELLGKAEGLFQGQDFVKAKDLIVKAQDSIQSARREHFSNLAQDTISSSQFILAEARNSGIDVSQAEAMLRKAEGLLNQSDYENAYSTALDAENLTKRSWESYRMQSTINAVEEVHSLLRETERIEGLDIKDAEQLLKDVEGLMTQKDYDSAMEYASKAEDILLKQRDEFATKVLPNNILTLHSRMDDMQNYGIDVNEPIKLLAEAERLFKEENYAQAQYSIRNALEKMSSKEQEFYVAAIPKMMDTAQNTLQDLSQMGIDMAEAERYLSEAKTHFDTKDYKEAHKTLTALFDAADDQKRGHIAQTLPGELDATKNMIAEMQQYGLDMSDVEASLSQAESLFGQKDIDAAKQAYDQARQKQQSMLMNYLPKDMDSVHDMIEEAVSYGMDVGDAESLLNQAEVLFNQEDYMGAKKRLEEAKKISLEKKEKYLGQLASSALESTKNLINEAAQRGADVASALDAIKDAQDALEDQDYESTQSLVKKATERANDALKRVKKTRQERRKEILSTAVEEARMILAEAEEEGGENITAIRDMLDAATAMIQSDDINDDDFDEATRMLSSAKEEATRSKENSKLRFAREAMQSSIILINNVKGFGIDVSEAEAIIAKWQDSINKGQFSNNEEFSAAIQEKLSSLKKPYQSRMVSNMLQSIRSQVAEARKAGANISSVEPMLRQAEEAFEQGDIDNSEALAKQTEKNLLAIRQQYRVTKLEEELKRAKKELSDAKGVGADIAGAEPKLASVEKALKDENYEEAEEGLREARALIAEKSKSYSAVLSQQNIEQALRELEALRAKGMPTPEVQQMISSAQDAYIKQDYQKANNFALTAIEMAKEIETNALKKSISEKMLLAREGITYLTNLKANVDESKNALVATQKAYKDGDLEKAAKEAERMLEVLAAAKRPYMSKITQETLSQSFMEIKAAKEVGADVTEPVRLLQMAQKAVESQKFEEANQMAVQARDTAKTARENFEQTKAITQVKELEAMVLDLKASGVDVKFAEGLLRKSMVAYDNKDYKSIPDLLAKAKDSLKEASARRNARHAESSIAFVQALSKYIKANIKGKEQEMKKADLFIQKAEGMYQKGSYESADKFAQQAQRVIEGLEHPNLAQFMFVFRQLQAAELVSNAREEFSRIKRAMPNIELAPAEELLRNAEKAFDSDAAFDESKEMVLQAKIMALEIEQGAQEGNANNELTMLHSLILQKKKENKDVSGLVKDYETAKAAFDGKDYKKCLAFVRKAKTTAGIG